MHIGWPWSALMMTAFGAIFIGVVWWYHKTGVATAGLGLHADRKSNPAGFWLIQALFGALALLLTVAGLLLLFRVLP